MYDKVRLYHTRNIMKELKKATMLKALAFPASAIVAMALGVSPVLADETEPTDDVLVQPSAESDPVESRQPVVEEPVLEIAEDPAADPTGVIRSGDKDTFAKDMPFGTITIQTEDMKTTSSNFSWESDNPDIKYDKNAEGYVKNYIVWAPNGMGVSDVTLDKEDAHVDGSVTLKWAGIATLQDGSKGDVVMTISNLYFDVPKVAVRNDQDKVIGYEDTQASGPIGFFSYTGYLGPAFARQADIGLEGDDHVVAMTCDIKVQVLKNGSVVDGDVLFSTFDLDVTDHYYGGKYNEGFEIVDGAISPAYIPETNHNLITGSGTETSANGVKFEATKADKDTYDTGFVVMADNNTGIQLHWQGKGQRMGTRLFTGNISHHIQSSTSKGGSIQTTNKGNPTGDLSEGNPLGPVNIDVPDGNNVNYLMKPEKGYHMQTLTVDGEEIDVSDVAEGQEKEITLADGSKAVLKKSTDGSYNFTFLDNKENHTIDVVWDPEYTITYDANGGTGSMEDQDYNGSDETMPSKDNEFTRPGKTFAGFKAYVKDPETGQETVLKDEAGNDLIFESAEDMKQYFDGKPGGTQIRMEAQWKHTVTYVNPVTGEIVQETVDVFNDDQDPTPPADPTMPGATFAGWKKVVDENGNIVYEAQWTKTVTYINPITGEVYMEKTTFDFNSDEPAGPGYEPTMPGATFAGWDREVDEYGNIVYKAKWIQTVTYIDPVTGEVYMEVTPFEYGKEPTGPANPSRDGFIFKGWKRTVDAFGNIVYEAIWEPIGQARPVTKSGVVQTDVPTHLGVWAALMSSATALFAGLGIRKKDEE